MKSGKFCARLSTHFKRRIGYRSKRTFRLKACKKISKDRLELDEGDPGFQLLIEEEIVAVIFFFSSTAYSIKFSIYYFLSFFCLLGLPFSSLIGITAPQISPIGQGLLYAEHRIN
jgi:hypothetical protein